MIMMIMMMIMMMMMMIIIIIIMMIITIAIIGWLFGCLRSARYDCCFSETWQAGRRKPK